MSTDSCGYEHPEPKSMANEPLVDILPTAYNGIPEKIETDEEPTDQGSASKVWEAIKQDYKSADRGDKVLMISTVLFQAWNQSRLQQAITVPAAINYYENNGYNEWKAAGLFALLNYAQQFGAAGTLGASARIFPESLETTTEEFPKIKQAAEKIDEKTTDNYAASLFTHSVAGQGVGAGPFVMAEVLADTKGATKNTVLFAEKVSRRIGITSGLIGLCALKLAEEYPENEVVQEVITYAKNPFTWIILGAVPFIPAVTKAGFKKLIKTFKNDKTQADNAL